jgi:ABC-type sugar transport system ATPase subunit
MRQVLSDAQPPHLELVEITKRFGSFVANEKVSLKLEPGTFHALLESPSVDQQIQCEDS